MAERGIDVPGVFRANIGGDIVHFLPRIAPSLSVRGADIGMAFDGAEHGGFGLDFENRPATFNQEVVRSGVAVRLGDAQAKFGGAGHEAELYQLAFHFVGERLDHFQDFRALRFKEDGAEK